MSEELDFNLYSLAVYVAAILFSVFLSQRLLKARGGYQPSLINCIIVGMPMALVLGLRSISVGYDTIRYVENSYRLLANLPKTEFLFTWIVTLTNRIAGAQHYTLMLTVFALITVTVALFAVTRIEEEHDNTFFVLLFGLVFFLCSTDQFRQMIAVGFVALAIVYFNRKKYVACILSIVLGFGFHNTTIIAALLYAFCLIMTSSRTTCITIRAGQLKLLQVKTSLLQVLAIVMAAVITVLLYNNLNIFNNILAIISPSYIRYHDDDSSLFYEQRH